MIEYVALGIGVLTLIGVLALLLLAWDGHRIIEWKPPIEDKGGEG